MADLPSILGGMAQGFLDFGKSAVDFFGTGGAAIGDLADTIRTGKVSTKNQDDFRKWLYNTDSVQDAAAKGLGTALNGVQTVADYIPGIGAVTRNPLFNAGQGALGGLADEFKTYGKDYDLGRAGERAAVSAGAALASGSLGDALKKSANPLLSSGAVQGLARGATSGAITGGGYAAIDGGDVMQSALQGAGTGALIGGATGVMQDFKPRKATYDMALTDDERQARIANAQKQIDDIGPIRRFTDDPNELAKRARVNELQDTIKAYQNGYDTVQDYNDALAARRANRRQFTTATTGTQQAQEYMMAHRPTQSGAYGYDITAGGEDAMMPTDAYNNLSRYTSFTEPKYLDETVAQLNAARNNPDAEVTIYRATPGDAINDGDWITLSRAYADTHNNTQLGGKGNILEQRVPARDIQFAGDDLMEWGYFPQRKDLGGTLADADMAVNNVMESRVAPGQLGLFDDMPTQTPKTGTRQTSLFDQPDNPYLDYYGADIDTTPLAPETPANPYAPVNGEVTQAMRDRASEIIDSLALKRQIPENELFNKIDPSTLPRGQQEIGRILDDKYSKGLKYSDVTDMMRETVSSEFDKRLGKNPSKEDLISFIFGNADETTKKEMMDKAIGLYVAPETMSEGTLNSMARNKISDSLYGDSISAINASNRTVRGGYTGALDSALSERLGIAPGNTFKKTGPYDRKGSYGRYEEYPSSPYKNNIMVDTRSNNEDAINTMAHERLHSFQTEAKKLYDQDRYSPEVKSAYDELAKDLKDAKAYRTGKEIKERYGSDVAYWRHHDEQEARMLQQYLDAKGYTGSNHHNEKRYLGLEYDDAKITPAFDKFFDKLRDLSKRGVALPALAALFGGGAYMASQNNDKEKEVK